MVFSKTLKLPPAAFTLPTIVWLSLPAPPPPMLTSLPPQCLMILSWISKFLHSVTSFTVKEIQSQILGLSRLSHCLPESWHHFIFLGAGGNKENILINLWFNLHSFKLLMPMFGSFLFCFFFSTFYSLYVPITIPLPGPRSRRPSPLPSPFPLREWRSPWVITHKISFFMNSFALCKS